MTEGRDRFWRDYYSDVHRQPHGWLDYSNERVQLQGFALSLEAAGMVAGRSALDIGCGKGQFAALLKALGAAAVTGMELVPHAIADLRERMPGITWMEGDAADPASYAGLQPCDLVFALEVLQYVPFAETVALLWRLVRPGGRLVGLIPNVECPIVAKPSERFGGRFMAKDAVGIAAVLQALPELECWRLRSMAFAEDQRLVPYAVSPWSDSVAWPERPNRFQFVAMRVGGPAPAASA